MNSYCCLLLIIKILICFGKICIAVFMVGYADSSFYWIFTVLLDYLQKEQ